MSDTRWVVLDEYSFDGGGTVEYRHPRTCGTKEAAEFRASQIERINRDEVGFVRCVVRPMDEVSVTVGDGGGQQGELARARRLQEVTADHLRKARRELREARAYVGRAERLLRGWAGDEGNLERARTPAHYRGDGLVTCSRALSSAMAQEMCPSADLMPAMAAYWWGCAFKYVWRMWSKSDPQADGEKAIDCIGRAVRAWRG